MAEKWTIVEKPFEREIVREIEYGIFAKNGKELVANVTSLKDAKLIAVAPRMLKALEALERTAGLPAASDDPARVEARAAIAAAKGE
ncbi:MAG: hypothetical protein EBR82_41115 [Caulobacteraceae bacterium]|nr:hypothetical protein [Caulobacteraceae bacterium]